MKQSIIAAFLLYFGAFSFNKAHAEGPNFTQQTPQNSQESINSYNDLRNIPVSSIGRDGTQGYAPVSQGPSKPAVWVATSTFAGSSSVASFYRRPNVVNVSTNAITIEKSLDGTSGDYVIQFPSETSPRVSTITAYNILFASNTAVLTGSAKAGIRVSTALANSWYRTYAVAHPDGVNFVVVADTNDCVASNYSMLNGFYGTNKWVCLNLQRFGDGSAAAQGWLAGTWAGSTGMFSNSVTTGLILQSVGMIGVVTAGVSSVGVSYTTGMSGTNIPPSLTHLWWFAGSNNVTAGAMRLECDSAHSGNFRISTIPTSGTVSIGQQGFCPVTNGLGVSESAGTGTNQIVINGFVDGALSGYGNPLF